MELSRGQEDYLLELLSGEYIIDPPYHSCVKNAIKRYARSTYTESDLDFLVTNPQSLAAVLHLNTTNSLTVFKKYFALWLNVCEYNGFDDDAHTCAYLINPDPTSEEKLLQIIDHGDHYQVLAAPEIRYMAKPRSQEKLTGSLPNAKPRNSLLSLATFNQLCENFLDFAQNSPNHLAPHTADTPNDYPLRLAEALSYSQSRQETWSTLRQKALQLPLISSTYLFSQRSRGLLLPSNIEWIHFLNSITTPKTAPQSTKPASPFSFIDRLLPTNLALPSMPSARPISFKLPPLPFFSHHRRPNPPRPRSHANSYPHPQTTATPTPPPAEKHSRRKIIKRPQQSFHWAKQKTTR